jgi:hypothetical protein
MKLFELYQQNTLQGTNNLKQISEAVTNKTGAVITVGNTQVRLGINSARYVLGLYESAVTNGTSEEFLEGLANLNPSMVMENHDTMQHIVDRFKHEVKNFVAVGDMSDDLYHALYDYYNLHGEMPYGTAKARDGDPHAWVYNQFNNDVDDYTDIVNPDMPATTMPGMSMMPRQESMYESKKVKMEEGWEEMQAMVKDRAEKEKKEKGTGKFDKKQTSTGTVYSRKYDSDSGHSIETGRDAEGKTKEKRSVGRPNSGISGSDETGTKFTDYGSWYHKSKRTHADRKISGSKNHAVAVIPKGKKFLVVGKWEDGSGTLIGKPSELITLDDLKSYKSGKGRPKKVREWIETLRFVAEGAKADRMVKHIEKSEKKAGKSDKDSESIAYATANKRGMLDNKNKK